MAFAVGRWFSTIEIVPRKDERTFVDLADRLGFSPSDTWSVGNSYRSDVEPAIAGGLSAICIDAHVWAHERPPSVPLEGHPRLHLAADVREVPNMIEAAVRAG